MVKDDGFIELSEQDFTAKKSGTSYNVMAQYDDGRYVTVLTVKDKDGQVMAFDGGLSIDDVDNLITLLENAKYVINNHII